MPKQEVPFAQWADEFSQMLVDETFKLLDAQTKNGKAATKEVASIFVARFTGVLLYRTLTDSNDIKDKNELYLHTSKNFSDLKSKLQDAVAAGFSGAMSKFTKKHVEYYCQVKPVPEPINKKMI